MRVLLLTPALPYPMHQGGALRNYGIIHGLHAAGHEVDLLSFSDGALDPASTPLAALCSAIETLTRPLRPVSERLRDLLLSNQADIARRLESDALRARLDTLLDAQHYDVVQFEGLEMAIYLPQVRARQPGAKLIYDAHNAEFALQRAILAVDRANWQRLPMAAYSWLQIGRIARFERDICQAADAVIAVSDEDAAALRTLHPNMRLAVVPNGIFADNYRQTGSALDLGGSALVFTGKMDYRPNIDAMLWFVHAILPLVRSEKPAARLYIVGQKPHASLEALRDLPGVEITGWVADVQPFLRAAAVYIAPLRMGSGTRLKLLEAMAAGCATVATTTAAAGLNSAVRDQMMIADGERDFAAAVSRLLGDPTERQKLGEAARAAVHSAYDWSALLPCLLALYGELSGG